MKNTFYIKSFDDYHDIFDHDPNSKRIELGCYPERKYDYNRYFGLFYKGKKPKTGPVIERMKRRVYFYDSKFDRLYNIDSFDLNDLIAGIYEAIRP